MKIARRPDYEAHNQFLRSRKEKEIYLGINTNINYLDDWCPNPAYGVINHKAGLFLGKIIFKKNKYGNLAPHYIPSNMGHIEQEVEKINPLWLDEINKDYEIPESPGIVYRTYEPLEPMLYPNNVKVLCKNSSKNITLTKAQIISYFTELHKLNTTFIKNYIDSINKKECIQAYLPTQEIYKTLIKLGILQKDMFKWGFDGYVLPNYYAKLVSIDYMKQQGKIFPIPYFDELFYAYLVWSLGEFTIPYYSGYIAEQKNMPFNLGAYIDDRKLIDGGYLQYKIGRYVYEYYIDILTPEVRRDYELFCIDAYSHSAYYNEGSFEIDPSYYIPTDEAGHYNKEGSGFAFQSPNLDFFGDMTIKPSPLGNYYFELEDNENTFIEYYQRIYPKLDNPPKGWSKEMMQKLDLKLE